MSTTFLSTSMQATSHSPGGIIPRWSPHAAAPYPRGRPTTPPQSALLLRRLRNDPILQLVADIGKQFPARSSSTRRSTTPQAKPRMVHSISKGPREVAGSSISRSRSSSAGAGAVFRTPTGIASRRIAPDALDQKSTRHGVGENSEVAPSSSFSTSSSTSSSSSSPLGLEPAERRASTDVSIRNNNVIAGDGVDLIMSVAP